LMKDNELRKKISTLVFEPVANPDKNDLDILRKGLKVYNESITGKYEENEIASFAKNNQGNIVGGIYGKLTAGADCRIAQVCG
jgi:hypothetical protein